MKELIPHNLEEYQRIYQYSIAKPEDFWEQIANSFEWYKKWDKVLDWNFEKPEIKWFEGAKLNITINCLDRHVAENPNKIALIWEPNDENEQVVTYTYAQLLKEVNKFCHVLKNNGFGKGDRIGIYMPMLPQAIIAILACARIGAIHSVIFGGFSAQSISDRIQDTMATGIITADGAFRGNKTIPLKDIVDEALKLPNQIKKVIVYKRTSQPIAFNETIDTWWHDELEKVSSDEFLPEPMNAEDELFILYTSGSTGKPKGVVHTIAGYMLYSAYTFQTVFQYKENQIHFCTADIGWITGHTYTVYGPLLSGATSLVFEGIPNYPDAARLWRIIEKHKVNILYTAPTAIRALMHDGIELPQKYEMSSLQTLGTVGEPINEEAWNWYNEFVGKNRCPIVDTWWQTETGGILISPLAGVTDTKPSFAMYPLPGIQPILVDSEGNEILGNNVRGNLCLKYPWPGMIRTTYNNHQRCKDSYFATYPNLYFTGDGCYRDADGFYRITGRVDDVLNVSGHRIGTAEVENAINAFSGVIESAVVGFSHPIKGEGIYAFVITDVTLLDEEELRNGIIQEVNKQIGAIAKPDKVQIVKGLPKTRSGKIMRRILRKIAQNDIENIGDTSTLLDPSVIDDILKNRIV